MNLRHFFIEQTWWGKLLGACFGFLMAGPAGALFGIIIGNFFDRGLKQHFADPYWHYHAEKRTRVHRIFFEATFSIMGCLAKVDGRVTKEAILAANALMNDLKLTSEQQQTAQRLFNEGKKPKFPLKSTLLTLYEAAHDNPALLKLFIDIQYRVAQLDELSEKKVQMMNIILSGLNFAPIFQQNRFYEDFSYHAYQQKNHHRSSSNAQQSPYYSTHTALQKAYAILEVKPSANKLEIKRAYRRLMSRHHPDKLMAQGLSENRLKAANETTQTIRKAYELICESKGW